LTTRIFTFRTWVSRTPTLIISLLLAFGACFAAADDTATKAKTGVIEVVFKTSLGDFTLALDPVAAPMTVANFLAYVDSGFYTNTLFHRVIPGFVIQGGGFAPGMQPKPTLPPVENESDNGLANDRGTISMARTNDPNSATSQFFINVANNAALNPRGGNPGYAVFGRVVEGMEVVDRIVAVPKVNLGRYRDVPAEDVVIQAAHRKAKSTTATGSDGGTGPFQLGVHYTTLAVPEQTAAPGRVEVVELFSFGCPHCYELDAHISQWGSEQASHVAFRQVPAIWNAPMKTLAQAYYAAEALGVEKQIHMKLFEAIVIRQQKISTPEELAAFYAANGVDRDAFNKAFASDAVALQVAQSETMTRRYNPAGVPEIIVNGKYRVDRMRAGGLAQMVAVVDYLVAKERQGQD
jgi:cyclophilin family peptidyl-prolyl cis-trans isomerase